MLHLYGAGAENLHVNFYAPILSISFEAIIFKSNERCDSYVFTNNRNRFDLIWL